MERVKIFDSLTGEVRYIINGTEVEEVAPPPEKDEPKSKKKKPVQKEAEEPKTGEE